MTKISNKNKIKKQEEKKKILRKNEGRKQERLTEKKEKLGFTGN